MSIARKYRPQYTYEDYCQWEGRWELIEGTPYAMSPSPGRIHQEISGSLFLIFDKVAEEHCNQCKVYLPVDWKISSNTVVQPDILIVFVNVTTDDIEIAPILTVEILSKLTAFKDRHEKFELYEQEGVEYYLIIDPEFKKIEVYQLIDNKFHLKATTPEHFDFTFKNGCQLPVNFSGIWEE